MAAPDFYDRVLEPPAPGMSTDEIFRWNYDLWQRTGGYINYIVNLQGLLASVDELNTLVGIDTTVEVQTQLDGKVSAADLGTMAYEDADDVGITGGTLETVTVTSSVVSGDLEVNVGSSGTTAITGASLLGDPVSVTTVDNAEDNLIAYTLAADALGTNGDYIDIDSWGTFAANANNKRLRVYFGSTVILDTGAVAANSGSWWIKAKIMRTGAATQKSIAFIGSSNSLISQVTAVATPTADTTAPIVVKTTGQGGAAADITQEGFSVQWFGA